MKNLVNPQVGRRSLRSMAKSIVALGATTALMVAGLAFVAVSPASAATITQGSPTTGSVTVSGSAAFTAQLTVTGNPAGLTFSSPGTSSPAGLVVSARGGVTATG